MTSQLVTFLMLRSLELVSFVFPNSQLVKSVHLGAEVQVIMGNIP